MFHSVTKHLPVAAMSSYPAVPGTGEGARMLSTSCMGTPAVKQEERPVICWGHNHPPLHNRPGTGPWRSEFTGHLFGPKELPHWG